jgi:hypothetical protein
MLLTRDDSSRDVDHDKNVRELALSDVHMEASQRRTMIARGVTNPSPIRCFASLRAMWRELCSLFSRTVILLQNSWFPRAVTLDHFAQSGYALYPLRSRYQHDRIRGTQTVLSIQPRATPTDSHIPVTAIDPHLFLEGQDRGEKTTRLSSAVWGTHRFCTRGSSGRKGARSQAWLFC